jgi:hypothetical protein
MAAHIELKKRENIIVGDWRFVGGLANWQNYNFFFKKEHLRRENL